MVVRLPDTAFRTHRGLVRNANEDCLGILPAYGLVVLADGMGGHSAGEIASRLGVQSISTELAAALRESVSEEGLDPALLRHAVDAANRAIRVAAEQTPEHEGMGTTVVVGLFRDNRLLYAHVGDSRLYLLRNGRLRQLTRDHSVIQALVDQGMFASHEEAHSAGMPRNLLSRGLGSDTGVEVDTAECPLEPGDVFLFCSDGLSDMVSDQTMEEVIQGAGDDLSGKADRLLALALANGGRDNISLVLVRPGVQ